MHGEVKTRKNYAAICIAVFFACVGFMAIPGGSHAQTAIPSVIVATSTSPVVWTTYNASGIVPSTATAVVLRAEATTQNPTIGSIRIRSTATSTPDTLLSGSASGGNTAAWMNRGFFPLGPGRTFQYTVDAGFDKGWDLRVIGYFTTAPPPVSLISVALTATPFSPTTGQSTITWSASGSTGCAATVPANWTTSTAISGSQIVSPGFTAETPIDDFVMYSLSCAWAGGVSLLGSIDLEPASPPDMTFWIDRTTISPTETAQISWSTTSATSCTGSDGLSAVQPTSMSGMAVTPAVTTIYTLTCNFSDGTTVAKSETVIVGPPAGAPSYGPICPNFGLERTAVYDLQDAAYAYGYGVVADNAGNVYVTGEQYAPGKGLDMYVAKYNSALVQQWIKVYDNPIFGPGGDESGNESGYGIAIAPDGSSVYVVGRQSDPSGLYSDIFVRKYNGSGDVQWVQAYDGGFTDIARAVAVDSTNGYVYVTGYTQKDENGDTYGDAIDMIVLSYSPAGGSQPAFPIEYGGPNNESAYGITVSGGNVYVTGYLQPTASNTDMGLWRFDKTSGVLAATWPKNYDSESTKTMPATSVSTTGAAWAYCPKGSNLSNPVATPTGSTITPDYLYDRCRGENATGGMWSGSPATTCTFTCSAYSAGFLNNNADIGYGVTVDVSGNIFVTGYQDTNGGDLFVRKYDPAGALVWLDAYNSGGTQNDVGRGAIFGNSGRVYVAGRQQTNNEDASLGEHFIHRNVPVLPASNPPLSGADWTTTRNFHCVGDTSNPSEGWEHAPTSIECDTGSHTQQSRPIESCTATVSGQECWWGGAFGTKFRCRNVFRQNTCYATLVESGLFTSTISKFIYKGDQVGLPEFNEMAFGIAATPSSLAGYETTANDVYVAGYTGENGGGMLLNKYSCNAAASAVVSSSLAASFIATPVSGTEPLEVRVDARGTAGNIVNYSWNFGDGAVRNNASSIETYTYDHDIVASTNYTITLTVRDTVGATSSSTESITVTPNNAPTASFTVTPVSGTAPLRVSVDGSASNDSLDPGGSIASFLWNWGDGTTDGVGEKATHTYTDPGPYTIRLTVTDNGGMPHFIEHAVTVTDRYQCTAPPCSDGQVCGPGIIEGTTQCYACLTNDDCGTGYRCLGTSCRQGTQCPDGSACPFDGKCPETVSCNPLATGATCPDGSACPATGACPAMKYSCVLSSSAVDTRCYVEEFGGCLIDTDCTAGITGGECVGSPGVCQYAKCLNTTDFGCTQDTECVNGDGICNAGVCNYVYDCAYGPGMSGGAAGLYATTTPSLMPKMPQGVQADGQACTKPTPDAPNNCEGINGCLYYNYNSNGTPIANSDNSVGTCINTFQGGTGCVYYQYRLGATQTEKINCLPRYAENVKTQPNAGIPDGCFVMDKGRAGKEYDCSSVDGCYYYLDGRIDCRYKNITDVSCTTATVATDCTAQPGTIAVCNANNLCEYQGNGCMYEPNPKGAISCPGVSKIATGGDNFVQCVLNPDGSLPGFLIAEGNKPLLACVTDKDCAVGDICINGTCYPQCNPDTGVSCATGDSCTTSCSTSADCQIDCTPGTTCIGGTICPASGLCQLTCDAGLCVVPDFCTAGSICESGWECPLSGICPDSIAACSGAIPNTPPNIAESTTSVLIGLSTTTAQLCKYSPTLAVSFADMITFLSTNNTTHSSTAPSHDGKNKYYAKCLDTALGTYSPACVIAYDQGCTSNDIGKTCLIPGGKEGTCGTSATGVSMCIPICSGAYPDTPPNLAAGTASVTIGLTTDTTQTCKYSSSPLVSYESPAMMTFANTNSTAHSSTAPSHDGANAYFVECYDSVLGKYSDKCSIPFDQGCTVDTIGETCLTAGGDMGTCDPSITGAITCIPICLGAFPTETLPATATTVSMGLETTTDQTCKYDTVSATAYADMPNTFATTGGMSHASTVPTSPGSHKYFVQCHDVALDAYSKTCSIPFTQEQFCPPGFTWNFATSVCEKPCSSTAMCETFGACIKNTGMCACPFNTSYDPESGACISCMLDPLLSGCGGGGGDSWTWCELHPLSPGCAPYPVCEGPDCSENSCNTLGYTFTGSAVLPSGNCDIVAILMALLSWIAWIIALLAVLSGLRAAYLYITAMGNEKNLILAKRYLVYTTIGVGVSVLAFSIVSITRALLDI